MKKQLAGTLRRMALRLDPGIVTTSEFHRIGEPLTANGVVSSILHESYQAYYAMPRGRLLVWSPYPLLPEEWKQVRAVLMANRWATENDLSEQLRAAIAQPITAEVEDRGWSIAVDLPTNR